MTAFFVSDWFKKTVEACRVIDSQVGILRKWLVKRVSFEPVAIVEYLDMQMYLLLKLGLLGNTFREIALVNQWPKDGIVSLGLEFLGFKGFWEGLEK